MRVASAGLEHLIELRQLDLNEPFPMPDRPFDVAISYDVVLHLRDRAQLFSQIARLLTPGGKFLFTDAGIVRGSISSEQIRLRSAHGFTQFAAVGFNERALEHAGFRLLQTEDRTANVMKNATGRLTARLARRGALERAEGADSFERQQAYLEAVIALARSAALSRMMYLAERR